MATVVVAKATALRKRNQLAERVIQIRRVSKVVKGGKNLAWAIVAVGNERGQVGIELVAGDVIGAVRKGVADGKTLGGCPAHQVKLDSSSD